MKVSVYFVTDTVWELNRYALPYYSVRTCAQAQNLHMLTVKLLKMKWYYEIECARMIKDDKYIKK
jgi:hypothetical protein